MARAFYTRLNGSRSNPPRHFLAGARPRGLLAFQPSADEGAFDRLVASIDPAWVEQALEATGTATLRTRKLPAEQVIWLVLGMAQSCAVTGNAGTADVKRSKPLKKEREVKIYPDMLKRTMHVKSVQDAQVDFFVFDTEGTLMVHYKMNEKDHKKINGLEKGTYTYQVFKNDEMSESGKIVIK